MKRIVFIAGAVAMVAAGIRAAAGAAVPLHTISGKILSISGNTIIVERRNGTTVTADLTEAIASARVGVIAPSVAIVLHGSYLTNGTFHCVSTSHAAPSLVDWASDQ